MAQSQKRIGGAPVAADDIVSADQESILGSGIATDPLTAGYRYTGEVPGMALSPITVLPGMAVQSHASLLGEPATDRPVGPANHAAQVVGIAVDANPNPDAISPVKVQFAGVVSLPTADWDAIAGTSGGLARGTVYYVSQSTAGNLTSTAPTSGQTSTQVGIALNATDLFLTIGVPVTH